MSHLWVFPFLLTKHISERRTAFVLECQALLAHDTCTLTRGVSQVPWQPAAHTQACAQDQRVGQGLRAYVRSQRKKTSSSSLTEFLHFRGAWGSSSSDTIWVLIYTFALTELAVELRPCCQNSTNR